MNDSVDERLEEEIDEAITEGQKENHAPLDDLHLARDSTPDFSNQGPPDTSNKENQELACEFENCPRTFTTRHDYK